jgi:hypothetical protein
MAADLGRLIEAVLSLHRALIDVAKREYERANGPVGNPYALFALLTQDASFQWLQPMTRLIVELEELRDRKGAPAVEEEVLAASERVRVLLASTEGGFNARLAEALDSHQGALAAHGRLRTFFRPS